MRVGFGPEDQSTSGSSFDFAEGRGVVVSSVVCNHTIPGFGTDCGYRVGLQRLTVDGKPTEDEVVEEFIKAGPTLDKNGNVLFHPGIGTGPDDPAPQDCGVLDGAEGNLLLSEGRGPDSKGKLARFGTSLVRYGVKKELLNGWAPNLLGLDAHFTRFMLEKQEGSTAKNNPSALIIGKLGKEEGGVVYAFPSAQTGVAPSVAAPAKAGAKKAGAGPKLPATNGAPAPALATPPAVAAAPVAAAAPTPTPAPAPSAFTDEEISQKALECLVYIGQAVPGKTATRTALIGRSVVIYAQQNGASKGQAFPAAIQPAVTAKLKDPAWFAENAPSVGWVVEGDNVTIPAV